MTIASSVRVAGGDLSVHGRTVLAVVPDAVVASSAAARGAIDGVFLGADFVEPASRHVVSLGAMRDVRFMACFRFKMWWMAQRMGEKGGNVPHETRFLLVESKAADGGEDAYVVFLPLVEGAFRASLQGGARDELQLCIESGDADTRARSFERALFVGAAEADPSQPSPAPSRLLGPASRPSAGSHRREIDRGSRGGRERRGGDREREEERDRHRNGCDGARANLFRPRGRPRPRRRGPSPG